MLLNGWFMLYRQNELVGLCCKFLAFRGPGTRVGLGLLCKTTHVSSCLRFCLHIFGFDSVGKGHAIDCPMPA